MPKHCHFIEWSALFEKQFFPSKYSPIALVINVNDKGDIISCDFNKSLRIDVASVHHVLSFTHVECVLPVFRRRKLSILQSWAIKCSSRRGNFHSNEENWGSLQVLSIKFIVLLFLLQNRKFNAQPFEDSKWKPLEDLPTRDSIRFFEDKNSKEHARFCQFRQWNEPSAHFWTETKFM